MACISSSSSNSNHRSPSSSPLDLLLKELETNIDTGLTSQQAAARRNHLNQVDPPIKCPAWVCCLLPCIQHIPKQKLFKQIVPEDAEVLRGGKWIVYDAASLVVGDIILLSEGDLIPADCTIVSVEQQEQQQGGGDNHEEDLLVDMRMITGDDSEPVCVPTSASTRATDEEQQRQEQKLIQVFYGGRVTRGSAKAVVTATGKDTALAKLIATNCWPPKEGGGSGAISAARRDEDQEVEFSLIAKDSLA